MIRNLKVPGLALVAMLAFAAMSASAASAANGLITSDGPFTLTGTYKPTSSFPLPWTLFGAEFIACHHSHYVGESPTSPTNPDLTSGATTITIIPQYFNCYVEGGLISMTVRMNGCSYLLHIGETTEAANTYNFIVDLVCPPGEQVEVPLYLGKEAGEPFCIVTFEAQNGLGGGIIEDELNGHLALGGAVEGIIASKHGALCSSGTSEGGVLHLAVTFEGKDANGNATAVSISHN